MQLERVVGTSDGNTMRGTGSRIGAAALVLVSLAVGVAGAATATGTEAPLHAVGVATTTYVDDSRPTAKNEDCPKIPSRTLPTTVYYPATGAASAAPVPDAQPDVDGGPYPLIVFAHGYGATAQSYEALLHQIAAAGYVVAAPTFPLSSGDSPCGAVAGDSANQPEDLTFVIDSVLRDAKADEGLLAGLVDPNQIGAAGHSNGAITMYGITASTKVRDDRVKAAVVMAGTPAGFPGKFDFSEAPPLLLVHGTDDQQVPYDLALTAFNRARGPKGLLTMEGGDHGSSAGPATYAATVDFFDAYLRGDAAARQRLPDDQQAGVSTMKFVTKQGSTETVPTLPRAELDLQASVTPRKGLQGGQVVTVQWSGYEPGKVVNILQCNPSSRQLTNSAGCDYTKAKLLLSNPTGEGSVQLEIVEGPVGDGICDAQHPGCIVVVNGASSSDPRNSRFIEISFAKG